MSKILQGDALTVLKTLDSESVDCCITSPPYFGLRDYGVEGQLGLEDTPEKFAKALVEVFREVRRVLKKEGTLWLNLGDSYNAGRNGGHAGGAKQASLKRHEGIDRSGANVVGLKPKDLIGIPWRVAFALQADGWWLRQDIIWSKPNPMPESITDRCTKAHEYVFLLSKNGGKAIIWRAKDTGEWSKTPDLTETIKDEDDEDIPRWSGKDYYFDNDAIKEPAAYAGQPSERKDAGKAIQESQGGLVATRPVGRTCNTRTDGSRNKRSVWTVNTKPFKGAHFATFPEKLVEPMILAGCPENGVVLDPFFGSGTTGVVAKKLNRNYVGIELNPEYIKIAEKRLNGITQNIFATV